MNRDTLSRSELIHALHVKAMERSSNAEIENYVKHLQSISQSPEIAKIWGNYCRNYSYADCIALSDVIALLNWIFEK
jgi:hypothetical protein